MEPYEFSHSSWYKQIMRDSVWLLPEVANASAREIQKLYEQDYLSQFPLEKNESLSSPERQKHYKSFWRKDGPLEYQRGLAEQRVLNSTLPPVLKELQRKYWVDVPADATKQQKGQFIRGTETFKAAGDVRALQQVLINNMTQGLAEQAPTRLFQSGPEVFGEMVVGIVERAFPNYQPGSNPTGLRSIVQYGLGKAFEAVQQFGRRETFSEPPQAAGSLGDVAGAQFGADFRDPGMNTQPPMPGMQTRTPSTEEVAADLAKMVYRDLPNQMPTNLRRGMKAMNPQHVLFLTGNASPRDIRDNPLYGKFLPPGENVKDLFHRERGVANQIWKHMEGYVSARPSITENQGFLQELVTAESERSRNLVYINDPRTGERVPMVTSQFENDPDAFMPQSRHPAKPPYPTKPWPLLTAGRQSLDPDQQYLLTSPDEATRGALIPQVRAARTLRQPWPLLTRGKSEAFLYGSSERKEWVPPYNRLDYIEQRAGRTVQSGYGLPQAGLYNPIPGDRPEREQRAMSPLEQIEWEQDRLESERRDVIGQRQNRNLQSAYVRTTHTGGSSISPTDLARNTQLNDMEYKLWQDGIEMVHGVRPPDRAVTTPQRVVDVAQQAAAPTSQHRRPPPPPTWSEENQWSKEAAVDPLGMKQRPTSFRARQLVPTEFVPGQHLSEEEAFEGAPGRGRAIDQTGYLRAIDPEGKPYQYISEVELAKKYPGMEGLQRSYMVQKLAGFHELGHVVFRYADATVRKEFLKVYTARLEQVGKENMLTARWPSKSASFREEFAQAYAAAAGLGGERLEKDFPEYAEFFRKYEDKIAKGEQAATLVEHMGETTALKPKAITRGRVLGNLPNFEDPNTAGSFQEEIDRVNAEGDPDDAREASVIARAEEQAARAGPRTAQQKSYGRMKAFDALRNHLRNTSGEGYSRQDIFKGMVKQITTSAETGVPMQVKHGSANIGGVRAAYTQAAMIAGYEISGDTGGWTNVPTSGGNTISSTVPRQEKRSDLWATSRSIEKSWERDRAANAKWREGHELTDEGSPNRNPSVAPRNAGYEADKKAYWRRQVRRAETVRNPENIVTQLRRDAINPENVRGTIQMGGSDMNIVDGELVTQEGTQVLNKGQVTQAANVANSALIKATEGSFQGAGGAGNVVGSVMQRFNKAIIDTYDKALAKDMPHAERAIIETQRAVSRSIGQGAIAKVTTGLEGQELGRAKTGAATAFRLNVNEANVDEVMAQNPALRARLDSEGVDPRALASSGGGGIQRIDDKGRALMFGRGGAGPAGPAGPGRGRLNLFGGRAGGMMYAAYITKRMWSMTAAPQVQAAQKYGEEISQGAPLFHILNAQQYGPMAGPGITSTETGFGARQRGVESFMQRGAFEQLGGITDAAYSFTGGSGAGPRAMSGLALAGGLATSGVIAGQTLGFMGAFGGSMGVQGAGMMAGLGSAISTVAIPAAVALAGTVGAMELYNAANPDQPPVSIGSVTRELSADWHRSQASKAAGGTTRQNLAAMFQGEGLEAIFGAPMSDAKLTQFMTPQARAIVNYQDQPEMTQNTIGMYKAIDEATGETGGGMYQALAKVVQGLGYVPKGFEDTARQWAEMGLSVEQGTNAFMQMSDAFGYIPGTPEFEGFWETFNSTMAENDISEFYRLQGSAARNAQFSGQIAPYFRSTSTAERLTKKNKLTTAARMGPVQSLMAVGSRGGLEGEDIVAYSATGREYTMFDMVREQVERRGNLLTYNVDTPLASALTGMGQEAQIALGAAERLGFSNAQQVQSAQRWLGAGAAYGVGYDDPERFISPIAGVSSYAGSAIPSIAEPLMRQGYTNAMQVLAGGMGQNLTDQQISQVGAMVGGDMGTISYMANTQPELFQDASQWNFRNQAGAPMFTTDFGAFTKTLQGRTGQMINAGLVPAGSQLSTSLRSLQMAGPGATQMQRTQALLGSSGIDQEMMGAFNISGQTAQTLHASRMAGYQRQSAGIAMAGVALSRRMLWGGGEWTGTPTEDSIWGIQDRQRALAHRQQMYNFGFSRDMMETQNEFAVRGEEIQGTRMAVNQANQRWQFGFQQEGMQMQRGWAQEDWNFQDSMRNMGFGWAMEDMDEAIRTSSGRKRSNLVRQKERATTKFNLEGEQVDTQRERQEETWAREDERFEKAQGYSETMMELDEEQFELQQEQRETVFEMNSEHLEKQIAFYQENKKLQDEMVAKQREYQAEQLALQAAAAAVQAQAAEEQETFSKAMGITSLAFDTMEKSTGEIIKHDPMAVFEALSDMVIEVDKLSTTKAQEIGKSFTSMSKVSDDIAHELAVLFAVIGNLDPRRLATIARLLAEIEGGF